MEWEPDALARLERVPLFIRKKVKKQIEDYVREKAGRVVTGEDVAAARRALVGGKRPEIKQTTGQGGDPSGPAEATLETPAGSLSSQELARIENLVEKGLVMEGLKTRYHEVKVCGGATGCPLTLINDAAIARALARILETSGLDQHLAGRIDGPVLFHHRFKVVVAGCPNACSQPQIADFGVIGQSFPGRGDDHCSGCSLCVEKCQENAVRLEPGGPAFDYTRCLGCGDCLRVCPTGAIKEKVKGYRVLIGGKLGRHPRLAETILEGAEENLVLIALETAVRFFMDHGRKGERLGQLLERTGREAITARLPGKAL
ncbi:4Fe-4S binding protein [Moorella sulfitireducens]|uniref:4Fe-4S binding protein n=1 Tax=Neomoorella sulfitireducens TaxID=2972948 RepID=UPI0021ABB602|nr:4Fe-4S binding protein [Moorella sulfitireducens]